jgi:hypothetical protein
MLSRRQQVRRRRQLRHLQAELGSASRVLEEVQGPECRELQQWRRAEVSVIKTPVANTMANNATARI